MQMGVWTILDTQTGVWTILDTQMGACLIMDIKTGAWAHLCRCSDFIFPKISVEFTICIKCSKFSMKTCGTTDRKENMMEN